MSSESHMISKFAFVHPTAVVHRNVYIENGAVIEPFCVLGDDSADYVCIGAGCHVRSHSVVYGGVEIGEGTSTGHYVMIRSGSKVGRSVSIGSYSVLEGNVEIGDCVRMQSACQISPRCKVGDFAQLFASVQFTNDRLPPSGFVDGVMVEPLAIVASNVLLLAGVTVGMGAFVCAGSFVSSDVRPGMVVRGNPARPVFPVTKLMSLEHGFRYHPWLLRCRDRYPQWAQEKIDHYVYTLSKIVDNIDSKLD